MKLKQEIYHKEYLVAVRNAVNMAKKGYSLAFAVKRACEQSGYPTKSHVDRAMREELGERFLELRAESARSNYGKGKARASDGLSFPRKHSVMQEVKKSETHYRSI